MQTLVVEPVDPFRGRELDAGQGAPGLAGLDQLGFVEADLGLHECVVQGVADGADRGIDAGLEEMAERTVYSALCPAPPSGDLRICGDDPNGGEAETTLN
ncbi:hypothetical protein OKW18_000720 [Streptomyces pratensis]|nr:hypothetical protein [Streptomyces pratensis]